jgi:hypothetical protein
MRRIVRRIVRLPLSFSATAQYVRPDGFTRGGDLVVVVRFNFRPLLSAAVFSLGCLKLGRSHIGKIRHRWRFGRAD